MKYTPKALELIKRFAAGVSCPKWSEATIEKTMFHPYCEDIARKTNKEEIDEDVVKFYCLKVHNPVTMRIGIIGKESIEVIKNCMVRSQKTTTGWVCVHGDKELMPISSEEAESLERENKKLIKGP